MKSNPGRIFGQAVLFIFAAVQQWPLFLLRQGVVLCTGPGKRMVPRLREFFRQGQAEVVSNSKNKILAT